jgi:hypothetical protein
VLTVLKACASVPVLAASLTSSFTTFSFFSPATFQLTNFNFYHCYYLELLPVEPNSALNDTPLLSLSFLLVFVYFSLPDTAQRKHSANTSGSMPPSNPRQSPRKRGARVSDPSSTSVTPLTGQFSRLSAGSRAHSLSPKKREIKQPLHIRMNLTETQMDKITDA